ncbi:hypothetical protein M404DRAFT_1005632 [Pisolithus tinctorius Marx 270]|uniref:Uncharacterized protein n=1 Tax=Pisolithus tinctorius Marx 270 TaxID=870435 RepID=A0A0C3NAI9_PISTI|nr:hypothetical protein M404DRAFT_1005632 [Pisolithus tinctorius Marx 270]
MRMGEGRRGAGPPSTRAYETCWLQHYRRRGTTVRTPPNRLRPPSNTFASAGEYES